MSTVTCIAPVNMAVIKYWGKRDEILILPINDNISATLDTEQMHAKTTVMASPHFKEDRIWLNGCEENILNPRLQRCLTEVKNRARVPADHKDWKVHICSVNNFPTAAGLASSAAGYACLVTALAKLYKIEGDISSLARIGSGSALRSTLGGFVRWYMGSATDGTDSVAKQIVPPSYWPEMRVLILVIHDEKKEVSSAIGMKRGYDTSKFLQYRAKHLVPKTVEIMQQAIIKKDFETFAELTMKDSNQMHATCLDSYPPCTYLNDSSFAVIKLVHAYNAAVNDVKVAYTFDAGPNAALYLLDKSVPDVIGLIDHFFPPPEDTTIEYRKGIPTHSIKPSPELLEKISVKVNLKNQLKYIIHTRVGDGPKFLEGSNDHLLDGAGLPIKAYTK